MSHINANIASIASFRRRSPNLSGTSHCSARPGRHCSRRLTMPKYYCDYCDVFLTHDSPSVRKTHNAGWKHKASVKAWYQQFEFDQIQMMIDEIVKNYEARMGMFANSCLDSPASSRMREGKKNSIYLTNYSNGAKSSCTCLCSRCSAHEYVIQNSALTRYFI